MIRSRTLFACLVSSLLLAGPAVAGSAVATRVEEIGGKMRALQDEHLTELAAMADLPAVRDYFLAPASKRPAQLGRVHGALDGRKMGSELCLIDEYGSEHLRAVHGRLAPSSELAHNEVSAPFFAPAIAMKAGERHVSIPYLSPDVLQWVVGYVVPVLPGKAILHFEHPIANLLTALPTDPAGSGRFLLMVNAEGFILGDSTRKIDLSVKDDKIEPASYFASIGKGGSPLPAGTAEAVLATDAGTTTAAWAERSWTVAWTRVGSLKLVGAEAAP